MERERQQNGSLVNGDDHAEDEAAGEHSDHREGFLLWDTRGKAMFGEPWRTAAVPMANPYCSCKRTRVRSGLTGQVVAEMSPYPTVVTVVSAQ